MVEPALDDAIAAFQPELPLAVGFSGGADSTALLLACAAKWPGQVSAVHINHGLQVAATVFEHQCSAVCGRFNIPLQVVRVNAKANPGQSPEAAARQARYQGFARIIQESHALPAIQNIALAHHADDQIETFLIALSRGAGLAGLSAMPQSLERDGITYWRPLLNVGAGEIRSWLAHKNVDFVDDPSNTDSRFLRNRIRSQLLGPLKLTFPQLRQPFARSLSHLAQAKELLDELAVSDLASVMQITAHSAPSPGPQIKSLQKLSQNRQGNLVRYWLVSQHQVIPSTAQLTELLRQVADCVTRGHHIDLKVAQGKVMRQGEYLAWYNP